MGILVEIEEIRSISQRVLTRSGVPEAHAVLQVELLLEAELRGRPSHGLLRLDRIVSRIANGVANPHTVGQQEWRGEAFLEVDGEAGLGPVVAQAALEAVCERAKTTGIAIAAIRNNNHIGMLAWYAEQVAAAGQTCIVLSTSEALVHPWGGRQAMLGTNPIAIAVPADPFPFVLDMATSLVSMGEIHDHANRNEPIPGNWALDADGNPTTDPVAAKAGSIGPFGGAKGYGLGLAFEVLVVALTASAIGRDVRGTLDATALCNKGDVFIVLDTHHASQMRAVVSQYLDTLRTSPPADGFSAVSVPGDRAQRCRAERLRHGVPLNIDVWRRLCSLAGQDITDKGITS